MASEVERGDALGLARALVRIPSVNPVLEAGGTGEADIARMTAEWLRAWGFRVSVDEVARGRFNTVGVLEGTEPGPGLVLNGHLDTVGVEGMTIDPFGAEVTGEGRLLGRGSCDMKGGVASLLSAAAALARDGLHRGRLIVALTADEEHASMGMASFVKSGFRADAGVVCEPTELKVMPAHKGFVWVDHHFRGRAAHGSRPEVGIDAIEHAGRYLALFPRLRERLQSAEPHPLLGHGSFHAGTIEGGSAASVYPAECTLVVERRTLPGETPEQVMAEFGKLATEAEKEIPGLSLELSRGLTRPPSEVPVESPLVTGLLEGLTRRGLPAEIGPMTAWVDAAFLNEAGIPTVCFGPGSIEQAHSEDEWIEAAQIEQCARVLEDCARTFFDTWDT